jgi:hypothetical protein
MYSAWMIGTPVVLFIGIYLVFYFSPSYAKRLTSTVAGPQDLNVKKTDFISVNDTIPFYSESEGTFSAFIYLNPMVRTGEHVDCGNSINKAHASCVNGKFDICMCEDNDCTASCSHGGYSSVFDIAGIVKLEVLTTPDASRQFKAMAQLVVQTEGIVTSGAGTQSMISQKYIESIQLPMIPFQKWVYVTVAREGRRFDIYYNDRMVVSRKLDNMPISNYSKSGLSGVSSGTEGLGGTIAVANLYNYRHTIADVSSIYSEYADTRGNPYMSNTPNTQTLSDYAGMFPTYSPTMYKNMYDMIPSISVCPPEGCFTPPAITPETSAMNWSSSY